ncbi:hypothetical protein [Ekhidna sp.]|uniref:hypothetical protein n=1 Tax=Ekhidna sp. TaxID=2608089 RepID=UPI003B5C1B23
MNYIQSIEKGLKERRSHREIVRKIFLSFPTKVFIGNEERQFTIIDNIAFYFQIPLNSVQIVGSAKTGRSFHKNSTFNSQNSDLDVAIIDSSLFLKYSEYVFNQTKGFRDRSDFPIRDGRSTYEEYRQYLARGIFRPDLMPTGKKRANWNKFFGKLSSKNKDMFKSINAGIYFSEMFFEYKQTKVIENYLNNRPI